MTQYNRLGWVQSMNFTPINHLIDVTTYADQSRTVIPSGYSEVEFQISGVALGTDGVFDLFQDWMKNGIYKPTFQKEWRCLYCTSPNSIERTHCTQCGAPRSFVIG